MSEFGDFWSSDPWERYNAHQRAKGRSPMQDSDALRKAEKEGRGGPQVASTSHPSPQGDHIDQGEKEAER